MHIRSPFLRRRFTVFVTPATSFLAIRVFTDFTDPMLVVKERIRSKTTIHFLVLGRTAKEGASSPNRAAGFLFG
jgi:hypothetical protein